MERNFTIDTNLERQLTGKEGREGNFQRAEGLGPFSDKVLNSSVGTKGISAFQ